MGGCEGHRENWGAAIGWLGGVDYGRGGMGVTMGGNWTKGGGGMRMLSDWEAK